VSAQSPSFGELARNLLSGIVGLARAIQEHVKGITPETSARQEPTNEQNSMPPFVRADVHIVEGIEIHKNATEARDERSYQSKTIRLSWLSFWVALATLISLIVYAFITHGQLVEMRKTVGVAQRQLDEMQADQRPWLQIKSAEIGFLKFDADNVNFNLKMTLKNTGKIPATGIEIWPVLHAMSDATFRSEDKDEQLACSMANRDYPSRKTGLTVFPDDTEPISTGPTMLVSDFPMLPNTRRGSILIVLGCIDYFISSNNTHGQTGFRFLIGRRGENPAISYAIYPDPGLLGPSDLMITKDLYGNYAK
jgi:hypothetical protein